MGKINYRLLAVMTAVAAVALAVVLSITAPLRSTRAGPLSAPSTDCGAVSCTLFLPLVFQGFPPLPQLEVTQAVQQPNNSVPLVANRTTFVRLTITSTTADADVNAWLHGTRDGAALPGSPLAALNNPRTLQPTADRNVLDDTFNFVLPSSWLNGTIALSTHATNSSTFTFESGAKTFQFVQSNPLPVTIVPIAYTCSSGGSGTTTPAPPYTYLTDLTYRMYPVPSVSTSTRASVAHSGPCFGGQPYPATSSEWSEMLYAVTDAWEADGAPNSYYYGLVKIYCGGSCISGMGWIGGPIATGFDGTNPSHSGATETHAHEVAHNHGRYHAPGCNAAGPDSSYPYISGGKSYIGNSAHPNYGFDIQTQAIYPYAQYYDITGYCGPKWVSDHTYQALLNWNQTQFAIGTAAVQSNRVLLVSGQIDPSSGQVTLRPAYSLDTLRAAHLPSSGEYTLELLDASGRIISSYPFAPTQAVADYFEAGPASEALGFHMTLPYTEAIQSIRVRRGDAVLGTLEAHARAPALDAGTSALNTDSGALHVTWSAKGAEGESLYYLVRASTDGGATWQTIGVNLSTPSIDLRSEDWAGKQVWVEVLASSGLRTSALQLGPFAVP